MTFITSANIQGEVEIRHCLVLRRQPIPLDRRENLSVLGPNLCCGKKSYFFHAHRWCHLAGFWEKKKSTWFVAFFSSSASKKSTLRVRNVHPLGLSLDSMGNVDASKSDLEFWKFWSKSVCRGSCVQGELLAIILLKASSSPLSIHQVCMGREGSKLHEQESQVMLQALINRCLQPRLIFPGFGDTYESFIKFEFLSELIMMPMCY